jgi:hypothetical protein
MVQAGLIRTGMATERFTVLMIPGGSTHVCATGSDQAPLLPDEAA